MDQKRFRVTPPRDGAILDNLTFDAVLDAVEAAGASREVISDLIKELGTQTDAPWAWIEVVETGQRIVCITPTRTCPTCWLAIPRESPCCAEERAREQALDAAKRAARPDPPHVGPRRRRGLSESSEEGGPPR